MSYRIQPVPKLPAHNVARARYIGCHNRYFHRKRLGNHVAETLENGSTKKHISGGYVGSNIMLPGNEPNHALKGSLCNRISEAPFTFART